ncbi:amidohydrolase [Novosphingobium sp.]|jgi:hippurate hydrolase|uniref:M20 metallopeptidase family protein n=1 Tax=Novosphingobium sp. TaxID=1874826 RepID=UPI0022C1F9E5|nr:amidohydrolase [Novosphingobium sp.]MCZ8017573.1 amidohydrolase [Novosphingobium sp.]MCZ8033903.1 amidohydrolase [Novosphingobium sp.]MCZ8051259.1 amidohydrolase [Novosphingobium sp.]MCZ8059605.1 amidohydrolase [Novosphingobium sp.]MCZ8231443.1 amidohydrolase [Novosphingobium sp.]
MKHIVTLAAALLATTAAPVQADPIRDRIAAEMPSLMAIYRDLHQHPELSFQEVRSARIMADAARAAGFEVTEKVGRTGVVAVMRNGPGPVVLVRADMDGLPIEEQTGLPYASKARGVSTAGVESGIMHGCGHDTHMAGWIGAARVLAANKDKWSGTLVMIGQPAEEINLGALEMIKDGLLTRWPKPDYTLAFHDSAELPSGTVGVKAGFALANVDSVDITVKGLGGHGAYPHTTKDPIVLASAIVMRLQTLVSRESNPMDPSVVTVGAFHGGAKHNIISDEVKMQLTVRSYSDASRKLLLDGIKRIARAEAQASGLPDDRMPVVTIADPYAKATYNTPELAERMRGVLTKRFGAERIANPQPSMAGEDFGEIARAAGPNTQSLILWIGGRPKAELEAAAKEGRQLPGLHSPFWAPEADKVISAGAEALVAATLELMPRR